MTILRAYKPTLESRTTTTFADDSHLTVTLAANTTYIFEALIGMDDRAIGTLEPVQFRFTAPGHTLGYYSYFRTALGTDGTGGGAGAFGKPPVETLTNSKAFSTITSYLGNANFGGIHHFDGIISVGGTGGTFALNWAATVTSTDTARVFQASWMMLTSV